MPLVFTLLNFAERKQALWVEACVYIGHAALHLLAKTSMMKLKFSLNTQSSRDKCHTESSMACSANLILCHATEICHILCTDLTEPKLLEALLFLMTDTRDIAYGKQLFLTFHGIRIFQACPAVFCASFGQSSLEFLYRSEHLLLQRGLKAPFALMFRLSFGWRERDIM